MSKRALTASEIIVIGDLLAQPSDPAALAPRYRGLPRRTYQVAKKRVYQLGMVFDRFIPSPPSVGIKGVTLAIGYPYAEHFESVLKTWREASECMILWCTRESIFGVFFNRQELRIGDHDLDANPSHYFRQLTTLQAEPNSEGIPVFFDYEGEWAQACGSAPAAYPRPLLPKGMEGRGGALLHSDKPTRTIEDAAIADIYRSYLEVRPGSVGAFRTRAPHRSALARRLLTHRVFLDPTALPPFNGWSPENVMFIRARLLNKMSPSALLEELVRSARITPFLYATDGPSIMMGGLGPRPIGVETDNGGRIRPPVLETLRHHLASIEVHRQSISEINVLRNHEYARLFLPPANPTTLDR